MAAFSCACKPELQHSQITLVMLPDNSDDHVHLFLPVVRFNFVSTNVFQLGLARENECHPCPAGKYCSGAGIETFPSNISGYCEAGFFCVSGVNTPRPSQNFSGIGGVCPPGAYCPVETSEPIGCPNGTFSNVSQLENVDQCTPCSDGHYCEQSNLTEPTGRQGLDVCPSLITPFLVIKLLCFQSSLSSDVLLFILFFFHQGNAHQAFIADEARTQQDQPVCQPLEDPAQRAISVNLVQRFL